MDLQTNFQRHFTIWLTSQGLRSEIFGISLFNCPNGWYLTEAENSSPDHKFLKFTFVSLYREIETLGQNKVGDVQCILSDPWPDTRVLGQGS